MTLLLPPATASPEDRAIVLPGATGTEGVARLNGSTFFAGDLLTGDVFRGRINEGTAAKFIDAPDGRFAAGMKADNSDDLLFVAGGPTGQGYVYDTRTGAPVSSYQFQTPPTPTFINDVALTKDGAWFTDSAQALLYFVPVVDGVPSSSFTTLTLSGPAGDLSGDFNNNGIQAVMGGAMLIVAHSGNGVLNLVDAATGASTTIEGVSVPNVDGILVKGGRELFAVQNATTRSASGSWRTTSSPASRGRPSRARCSSSPRRWPASAVVSRWRMRSSTPASRRPRRSTRSSSCIADLPRSRMSCSVRGRQQGDPGGAPTAWLSSGLRGGAVTVRLSASARADGVGCGCLVDEFGVGERLDQTRQVAHRSTSLGTLRRWWRRSTSGAIPARAARVSPTTPSIAVRREPAAEPSCRSSVG